MKIDFNNSGEDRQLAENLRRILTDYCKQNSGDSSCKLIENLIKQIDNRLAGSDPENTDTASSIPGFMSSFWNFLSGPSNREMELSKQRKELVERAEHAEAIAFEALADSSDMKKQYDEALHKIRELEQELAKKPG